MSLTRELLAQIRTNADSGYTPDDDQWNDICDAADAHLLSLEAPPQSGESAIEAIKQAALNTIREYAGGCKGRNRECGEQIEQLAEFVEIAMDEAAPPAERAAAGSVPLGTISTCPSCEGSGKRVENDAPCWRCSGSGKVMAYRETPEQFAGRMEKVNAFVSACNPAAGSVTVPREPTKAMESAAFAVFEIKPGQNGFATGTDARNAIYRAMLAAAPDEPQRAEPVAWRWRQRGPSQVEWQEWHSVGHKPQGPASNLFQFEPLYAAPQSASPSASDKALAERLDFIANNTTTVNPEEIEAACDLASARILSASPEVVAQKPYCWVIEWENGNLDFVDSDPGLTNSNNVTKPLYE